jgi:TonB family protein
MGFLLYFLKVNVAIILFYSFYRLLFQQDTFFRWKRMALLAIISISLLYPFADIAVNLFRNETVENGILPIFILPEAIYTLPEVNITGQTAAEQAVSFVHSLPQLLFALYGTAVFLLLGRLLLQAGMIIRMMQGAQKTKLHGQTAYHHPNIKTPFSFFGWIVLNPTLYADTELQEILRHEETHVREVHFIDTLLAELLCAFCWFNPFAWLLKREIRMNLEFLADRSVLASGYEAEHYQYHLLRLTYHKAAAKITNNFNVSLLKKRIFMMNKKQTSKLGIFKYTLLIPVIGALIFFNNALKLQAGTVKMTEIVQAVETITTIETAKVEEMVKTGKPVVQDVVPQTQDKVREVPSPEIADLIEHKVVVTQTQDKPQIFSHVEVMPSFPGGEVALMKWLNENMQYPVIAQQEGIQGRVIVRFVIGPDGTVSDAEIMRSADPSLDREALRIVLKMPKWIPGKQNRETVSTYFVLPINFKLAGSDTGTTKHDSPDSANDISEVEKVVLLENIVVTASGVKPKVELATKISDDVIIEVDGKVIPKSEYSKIDPNSIESVNVFKNENKISITLKK